MTQRSITPDFSAFEVPIDVWSEPFWEGGKTGEVRMPRCVHCATFRWPAGPFCPKCRTQPVEWVQPGQARIYSFTILPVRGADPGEAPGARIPALVSFDEAPGVRLVSVLVDAEPASVAIGAPIAITWHPAANAVVPVFTLADPS